MHFYNRVTKCFARQATMDNVKKKKKSYRSSSRMRSRDVGESVEQREEIQKLEKR